MAPVEGPFCLAVADYEAPRDGHVALGHRAIKRREVMLMFMLQGLRISRRGWGTYYVMRTYSVWGGLFMLIQKFTET